jgi:plastocyanin
MKTTTCLRIAAITLALAACKKEAAPEAPAPAPAAPSAPAAAAPGPTGQGTITGTVKLTGTPPLMEMTKRQADPFCAKTPMKEEEVIIGAGGTLKNVVVRISQGISGHYEAPPAPAALDQSACMYRPRVQGIVVGQSLAITNSDQTLHNIHGFKGPSTLFNQAEIPGMAPINRKLTDADQMVKFKCDVHPWMTGYVFVSSHPFFAVTADNGSFKIGNVPPGKYTLEAWHERFGTRTTEVTVADKPIEVAFQYESK